MASNEDGQPGQPALASRFMGTLRDALVAAGREEGRGKADQARPPLPAQAPAAALPMPAPADVAVEAPPPTGGAEASPSAAEAAREARGETLRAGEWRLEPDGPPTTRVLRGGGKPAVPQPPQRTQIVRGRQPVARGNFRTDPVVAWLVVVGGPGLGEFRPVFEGNNTVGRAPTQRVPLDFGDDTISHEEQAYIRYDSSERSFLFVPNLAKTNVVSVNNRRPTAAVELAAMDVITMGRTQLVFVPFCGQDFDWSEIAETRD
jgi:hypothetical protein